LNFDMPLTLGLPGHGRKHEGDRAKMPEFFSALLAHGECDKNSHTIDSRLAALRIKFAPQGFKGWDSPVFSVRLLHRGAANERSLTLALPQHEPISAKSQFRRSCSALRMALRRDDRLGDGFNYPCSGPQAEYRGDYDG
jgi:hypothetical protein